MEEANILTENDQVWSNTCYLLDSDKKIDFVLVSKVMKTREEMEKLAFFMENLVQQGLEFETVRGLKDQNLVYINIHAPIYILTELANIYSIVLEFNSRRSVTKRKSKPGIFDTVLTFPFSDSPLREKAPQTLSGEYARTITSAERSLLVKKLLDKTKFSEYEYDFGIKAMVKQGILIEYYPLHDSVAELPKEGYWSDRQLLSKYWASFFYICKKQPLDVIWKYFGPEVAFYFAFSDFYMKMLIPAAVVGVLCFLYSLFAVTSNNETIKYICSSEQYLCRFCWLKNENCDNIKLKDIGCANAKISVYFDNIPNMAFAIFMSFWATIFMELWRRRETILKFRWNLMSAESGYEIRQEAYVNMKKRISSLTGQIEYYIPPNVRVATYTFTIVCSALMISVVLLLIFFSMIAKSILIKNILMMHSEFLRQHIGLIVMYSVTFLTVIAMKIIFFYLIKLAIFLTNRENPRTITEFNNSCICKAYILCFVNLYFPIFYSAFVKGKIYTHPGDIESDSVFMQFKTDLCEPSGCLYTVSVQVLLYLSLKTCIPKIMYTLYMYIKMLKKKIKAKKEMILPQWELDQGLKKCNRAFMLYEFMELSMQYGYTTFFVSALPLAPLLALLTNIFDCRLHAKKFINVYRRPCSVFYPGIGAWNKVFRVATFMGTVTNAFVIAFTSETAGHIIYSMENEKLTGFVNSTLSLFNVNDYKIKNVARNYTDVCIYRGQRYPYYHSLKYELTDSFWRGMAYKLGFIVLFQQFLWILTSILAAAITDIPKKVSQDLNDEMVKIKEIRFGFLFASQEQHVGVRNFKVD